MRLKTLFYHAVSNPLCAMGISDSGWLFDV